MDGGVALRFGRLAGPNETKGITRLTIEGFASYSGITSNWSPDHDESRLLRINPRSRRAQEDMCTPYLPVVDQHAPH